MNLNEQVKEIIKCTDSPLYFIEEYCLLYDPKQHEDFPYINLRLTSEQLNMLVEIQEHGFTEFSGKRQNGKSTLVIAYILWYILFNDNKTVTFLNSHIVSDSFMVRLKNMYKLLPTFMQGKIQFSSRNIIELENESKVICCNMFNCKNNISNLIYIDEPDFIKIDDKKWKEFFIATYPMIYHNETKIIITKWNGKDA